MHSTNKLAVLAAIVVTVGGGNVALGQCPPTGAECTLVRFLPCDLKPGDSLRGYDAEGNRVIAAASGADDASPR